MIGSMKVKNLQRTFDLLFKKRLNLYVKFQLIEFKYIKYKH